MESIVFYWCSFHVLKVVILRDDQKMEQKKSYEIDMCNGPILSKMLLFTIPLMCSSMLQLLFNAADIVVVGRYAGDNSLAAVGSNTSLIGLLTNLFLGLSIGANVLVARYYGAKREEELKQTVHTAILLSIYSGIILTVLGCFGAKQILIWQKSRKKKRRMCRCRSSTLSSRERNGSASYIKTSYKWGKM